MQHPTNYILDVADPFKLAMEGFQSGTAMRRQPELEAREKVEQQQSDARFSREQIENSQRDVLFGQGQEDRQRQIAQIAQQRERGKALQSDMAALSENPNAGADDYARVITKYPEISQDLSRGWNALDEAQKGERLNALGSVYSAIKSDRTDMAIDLLEQRHSALIKDGRTEDAQNTKALLEIVKLDPASGKTAVGIALRSLGGAQFDSILGSGEKVRATRILTNGTTIQSTDDGVRVQTADGKTLEGEAAVNAVQIANQEEIKLAQAGKFGERAGTLNADIALGGQAKATEAAAAEQIKMGSDALKGTASIRKNIANLDSVIAALDNGAKTGAVQKFLPNISAASVELNNIRNRLGLDIISDITFGALSEKELSLALTTGLPDGLDEQELRDWATRKKKVQQQYAAALEAAAIHLLDPENTLKGWIELQQQQAKDKAPDEPDDEGRPGTSFLNRLSE